MRQTGLSTGPPWPSALRADSGAAAGLVVDVSMTTARPPLPLVNLQVLIQALDSNHPEAAVNKMEAFINQVESMVNAGSLPAEDGQPLLAEAEMILLLMLT